MQSNTTASFLKPVSVPSLKNVELKKTSPTFQSGPMSGPIQQPKQILASGKYSIGPSKQPVTPAPTKSAQPVGIANLISTMAVLSVPSSVSTTNLAANGKSIVSAKLAV